MADAVNDEKKPDATPGAEDSASKAADAEYWKSEAKKAFEDRNKAIQKAKAFEDAQLKAEQDRIAETGKFKEAYEKVIPELEQLRQFKTLSDERTKAKLAESEKALPEEHKAEYEKFISKLPEDERIDWINLRLAVKPAVGSSPGNARPGNNGKPTTQVKEMSWEDRLKLAKEDPESFRKLV